MFIFRLVVTCEIVVILWWCCGIEVPIGLSVSMYSYSHSNAYATAYSGMGGLSRVKGVFSEHGARSREGDHCICARSRTYGGNILNIEVI